MRLNKEQFKNVQALKLLKFKNILGLLKKWRSYKRKKVYVLKKKSVDFLCEVNEYIPR